MQSGSSSTGQDFGAFIDQMGTPSSKDDQQLFGIGGMGSQLSHFGSLDQQMQEEFYFHEEIGEYQILGQMWNMYIALQADQALYLIDQHALAERIAFEQMKVHQDLTPETLLQPLKFEVSQIADLESKLEQLNQLGFEISQLSENTIVIYALPKVFVQHPVEI